MINPIMEALKGRAPTPNNFVQLYKMMQGASNPNQMMQNLIQSNPQVKNIMQMVQNSNMSPKDLFYSMAQQKGVDPNQILNMFK